MAENDPTWSDGESKIIDSSGTAPDGDLWSDGESKIIHEYVESGGGLSIPIVMAYYKRRRIT